MGVGQFHTDSSLPRKQHCDGTPHQPSPHQPSSDNKRTRRRPLTPFNYPIITINRHSSTPPRITATSHHINAIRREIHAGGGDGGCRVRPLSPNPSIPQRSSCETSQHQYLQVVQQVGMHSQEKSEIPNGTRKKLEELVGISTTTEPRGKKHEAYKRTCICLALSNFRGPRMDVSVNVCPSCHKRIKPFKPRCFFEPQDHTHRPLLSKVTAFPTTHQTSPMNACFRAGPNQKCRSKKRYCIT